MQRDGWGKSTRDIGTLSVCLPEELQIANGIDMALRLSCWTDSHPEHLRTSGEGLSADFAVLTKIRPSAHRLSKAHP